MMLVSVIMLMPICMIMCTPLILYDDYIRNTEAHTHHIYLYPEFQELTGPVQVVIKSIDEEDNGNHYDVQESVS